MVGYDFAGDPPLPDFFRGGPQGLKVPTPIPDVLKASISREVIITFCAPIDLTCRRFDPILFRKLCFHSFFSRPPSFFLLSVTRLGRSGAGGPVELLVITCRLKFYRVSSWPTRVCLETFLPRGEASFFSFAEGFFFFPSYAQPRHPRVDSLPPAFWSGFPLARDGFFSIFS